MQTQKPKWKTWHFVVIGLCFFGVIGIIVGGKDESSKTATTEKMTQAQKDSASRREKLEKAFSKWDGSQNNLVTLVKSNMNNPKSFEHVETTFSDLGDSAIIVFMRYRGTNAFGGVVTNTIKVRTDIDGNILNVIEQ